MEITGEFGTKNLISRQGIKVDLSKRSFTKFEKIFSLFTFKEQSKPLPNIEYILVFKTLYGGCSSCSLKDFEESSITQLSFVYNKNRKLIIHESKEMEDIMNLAKQIATEMQLRILDSATDRRHSKWID